MSHSYRLRFTDGDVDDEKRGSNGPYYITLISMNGTVDVIATGGNGKTYDEKEDTVYNLYSLISEKYGTDFFKLRIMDPEFMDEPLPDIKIPILTDDDGHVFEQSVKDIVEADDERIFYKWNVTFESTVFHYLPNYLPGNRSFHAVKNVHSRNTRHQSRTLSSAYDREMRQVETPLPKRDLTLRWFVDIDVEDDA